ncbi:MAG TPA: alpha/beta hydrolase [Dehalococcoidia bacterium]|nr:alpha/beta hydrolase [Dehalococcoidia bacterium]
MSQDTFSEEVTSHLSGTGLRPECIKVGQLDIHYLTGGEGEPLIVIHGGGGSGLAWLKNAAELSKYYQVYLPDLPGFGRSKAIAEDFELSSYVAFVEDFSRSLGLGHFHLIGHSLGGGIALNYALRFPHKIKRLVLVSSLCLGREIAFWSRILSLPVFYRVAKKTVVSIFKAIGWLIRKLNCPLEKITPPPLLRMSIGKSMMTVKGQTTVLVNRLSELLIPTLLVWGANDNIVPVHQAYLAAARIPNCQVRVFQNSGHSVYRQRIREFSDLLVRFLG